MDEVIKRVERRFFALEQLFHSESKLFADQDGTWTIPMLRSEAMSLARAGLDRIKDQSHGL